MIDKTRRVLRWRRGVLAAGAIVLVAALAAAGGYLYFFSGLRSTPSTLVLSSTPQASETPLANLSGRWEVEAASTPQVGYRVKEQFTNQTTAREAVARTNELSGGLTVRDSGGDLRAGDIQFTVKLAHLHSVDEVAGRDVSQRDVFVQQSLDVAHYPTATFQATSVALPRAIREASTVVDFDVPGRLTIHGVTRDVRLHLQGRLSGGEFQVAGSTQIAMDDYNVDPPEVPFVTVEPTAVLELLAVLQRQD